MGSYRSDIDALAAAAKRQGITFEWQANGHGRFTRQADRSFVTCSGSPSDIHAIDNVRRDLVRRLGFKELKNGATISLGDVLKAAAAPASEPALEPAPSAQPTHARGITDFIRDRLRSTGREHTTAEMAMVVQARFPDADRGLSTVTLARLYQQGEITKTGHGCYRWPATPAAAPVTVAALPPPPVAPTPPDVPPSDDERELDEALAALAKIEAVVRRHKAVLGQLATLKKLLNGDA